MISSYSIWMSFPLLVFDHACMDCTFNYETARKIKIQPTHLAVSTWIEQLFIINRYRMLLLLFLFVFKH